MIEYNKKFVVFDKCTRCSNFFFILYLSTHLFPNIIISTI